MNGDLLAIQQLLGSSAIQTPTSATLPLSKERRDELENRQQAHGRYKALRRAPNAHFSGTNLFTVTCRQHIRYQFSSTTIRV
jgi:hypothetical protein